MSRINLRTSAKASTDSIGTKESLCPRVMHAHGRLNYAASLGYNNGPWSEAGAYAQYLLSEQHDTIATSERHMPTETWKQRLH